MAEPLPALTFLGHSTVRLDIGGRRVLTDPILRQHVTFLARHAVPLPRSYFADIDLVLISHLHHDHCDLPSLRMLGFDVPVLVPVGAGDWLRSKGFLDVHELGVGETYRRRRAVGPRGHRGAPRQARAVRSVRRRDRLRPRGGTGVRLLRRRHRPLPGDGRPRGRRWMSRCCRCGAGGRTSGPGHLDPRPRCRRPPRIIRPALRRPGALGDALSLRDATGAARPPLRSSVAFAAAVAALDLPVTVLHTPPGERVSFTP